MVPKELRSFYAYDEVPDGAKVVYVLRNCEQDDGSLIGVFATKEAAQRALAGHPSVWCTEVEAWLVEE